jgi:hypothetical protein
MIVYRLEHTVCPEGKPGHGPVRSPSECKYLQTFGTFHTGPSGDPWQPERLDRRPCGLCHGTGIEQDGTWSGTCYWCNGKGRKLLYIDIVDEQVCGVTREQLPLWAEGGAPKLYDGWEVIVYRVDGRFRHTRRGEYQVVFRREDADIVGRITNEEQLEPLLRPPVAARLDTAPRAAA